MLLGAFTLGYLIGAATVTTAAVLVFFTPDEVIRLIKEERAKRGR